MAGTYRKIMSMCAVPISLPPHSAVAEKIGLEMLNWQGHEKRLASELAVSHIIAHNTRSTLHRQDRSRYESSSVDLDLDLVLASGSKVNKEASEYHSEKSTIGIPVW